MHNQELPHDQGKALFSQELRKFIAKQTIIAEAAMNADDNEARAKRIGSNHVYKVGKQNGRKQSQNATHSYEQSALYLTQGILLACDNTCYKSDDKRQIALVYKKEQQNCRPKEKDLVIYFGV